MQKLVHGITGNYGTPVVKQLYEEAKAVKNYALVLFLRSFVTKLPMS